MTIDYEALGATRSDTPRGTRRRGADAAWAAFLELVERMVSESTGVSRDEIVLRAAATDEGQTLLRRYWNAEDGRLTKGDAGVRELSWNVIERAADAIQKRDPSRTRAQSLADALNTPGGKVAYALHRAFADGATVGDVAIRDSGRAGLEALQKHIDRVAGTDPVRRVQLVEDPTIADLFERFTAAARRGL